MPGAPRAATSSPTHVEVAGVAVPRLIYGTAWKEDQTATLTRTALEAGFRGVDTANQRRHYFEAGVGEALRNALETGRVRRHDLFVQTKFTFLRGQDHRLPYDPEAPVAAQVEQSMDRSLEHLGLDHVDAYLLHGPATYPDLSDDDWEAWAAMEGLQRSGRTRLLGVSNVLVGQLESLYDRASVQPALVQNRCFTRPRSDGEVRAFCRRRGLGYQGFSLLTARPDLPSHPVMGRIVARTGLTVPQVVFRYALDRGMHVLTGTTSPGHMAEDLAVTDLRLGPDDVKAMDSVLEGLPG